MTNPFQFYPRERIENADSQILYVFFADELNSLIQDQGYDPLTEDELEQLPMVFAETDRDEYLFQVYDELRPNNQD